MQQRCPKGRLSLSLKVHLIAWIYGGCNWEVVNSFPFASENLKTSKFIYLVVLGSCSIGSAEIIFHLFVETWKL